MGRGGWARGAIRRPGSWLVAVNGLLTPMPGGYRRLTEGPRLGLLVGGRVRSHLGQVATRLWPLRGPQRPRLPYDSEALLPSGYPGAMALPPGTGFFQARPAQGSCPYRENTVLPVL